MNEREIIVHAFLTADRVITEDNGKKGLIGIFNMFNFPKFPAQAPPWFVFLSLDNVMGRNEFTVNFVHQETQQVLFSAGGGFEVKGPMPSAELGLPVPSLLFQRPGAHVLSFVLNTRERATKIIQVNTIQIQR
jgi:hypothetical protein